MAIDKIFDGAVDGIADNLFNSVSNSVSEIKAMQQRKAAENVQLVVQALKKIDADIREKYDGVTETFDKRIASIKDGRDGKDGKNGLDGVNGKDGRDGKDGRNGRDGLTGPRGFDGPKGLDGKDGRDGEDGVSVTDAHIDFDGSLIISLSSGRVINVGEVVAADIAEKIKVITNGGGTSQPVLDQLASLQAQIDLISSALVYKGTWNASTNTPTLTSSVGTANTFYIVSVAGTTNLNGTSNWGVGDWAVFNGSVWQRVEGGAVGNFTDLTVSGTTTLSNLTASTALALNSSKEVVSVTNTGTGNNVLATSPTLVTPVLGTPSSVTLTNATGLPLSSGVTGTLPIANGGTGQTTANAAFNALAPSQTSNAGKYLTTDGTNTSWATNAGGDVTGPASATANGIVLFNSTTGKIIKNSSSTDGLIQGMTVGLGSGSNTANTAFGLSTLNLNSSGNANTAIGWLALAGNTTGNDNTAVGYYAGALNSIGDGNSSFGKYAGSSVTGSNNTAIGNESLRTSTSGSNNTAIGYNSGKDISTGGKNVIIGSYTGFGAPISQTGSNHIVFSDGDANVRGFFNSSGALNIASLTASKLVFTDASKNLTSTGTVAISQGGTGLTTTPANGALDIGNGTGFTRTTLTAGTGVTITNASGSITINATGTGGTVTSVGGTGTVSGISLSGTVTSSGNLTLGGSLDLSAYSGAGAFTTLSASSTVTLSGGTANGVSYLNGSKVLTTGTALQFDGTNLLVGTTTSLYTNTGRSCIELNGSTDSLIAFKSGGTSSGYLYGGSAALQLYATGVSTVLTFGTNGQERLRIDASGNVGVGVSAGQKFHVENNANSSTWMKVANTNTGSGAAAGVLFTNDGGDLGAISLLSSTNSPANGLFLRSLSTNPLVFGINNTEQLRLTSTSLYTASGINVGIGNSSPAYKLDVNGVINSNDSIVITKSGSDSVGSGPYFYLRDAASPSSAWVTQLGASGTYDFWNYTTGPGWSRKATLDSSGNLGLGVTPSAWLSGYRAFEMPQIALFSGGGGGGFLYGNAYLNTSGTPIYKVTGLGATSINNQGGAFSFNIAGSGTAGNAITFTQAMTLDASGNLLVGATSSGGIGLTCFPAGYIRANTNGTTLGQYQYASSMMGTITTDGANIAYNANNALVFGSGGTTERARIDSSGNLLVGTTGGSGAWKLYAVSGATQSVCLFENPATSGQTVGKFTRTASDGTAISFSRGGSDVGTISITTTATAYNTSSDYRLKENIQDAESASTLIDSLQVRQFDWKADGSHQRYGFVAQELVTVAPEAVHQPEDTDEMMAVDYSKLVPMLVKEIQSLRKRLADAGL